MKHFYLLLFAFLSSNLCFAADHFWIGGSGNWNDANHWSATSGGAAGVTIPGIGDNALFDANSGLNSVLDIVSVNVNVTVDDFNFSAVPNLFTFDMPLAVTFELRASLFGNTTGVNFTGVWGEINMNSSISGEVISSQGTVWIQDFRISNNQITINDAFNIGTGILNVDLGGIDFGGNALSCFEFHSNVATVRTIDVSNATLTITGGFWEIDPTNLTWLAGSSEIILGDNATIAEFHGGGLPYDIVRSNTANEFRCFSDNTFGLLEVVPSSQFKIDNGTVVTMDSLIANGTCLAPLFISTIALGGSATLQKTSFPFLTMAGVDINNINSSAGTYNLIKSDTTLALGWTMVGTTMYWIGDAGNWSDGSHWSYSSGGVPSGCVPDTFDIVLFDVNSFSIPGQNVIVDDVASFASMDWTGIVGNQNMLLDSTMLSFGNITLSPNLSLRRNNFAASIRFKDQSLLSPNMAQVDCIFRVAMSDPTKSVLLMDDLTMSDTSSIILSNGNFDTQSNNLKTGSLYSFNDAGSGLDSRILSFGNSTIELVREFYALTDSALTLNAGTSDLYIGDTVQYLPSLVAYKNGLQTFGLTFFDVTLNFQELVTKQFVDGNNTFNKLKILAGSKILFRENTTQTVNDSLILDGKCGNTLFIGSSDYLTNSNVASINKLNSNLDFYGQGTEYRLMDFFGGLALTTFESIDSTGNVNLTFDASPTVTSSFTVNGPYCFGDTTGLTNNSTVQSGLAADLTSLWYFNDGSTGYYANPPTDSTWISYVSDTNQHVFIAGGDINVIVISINNLNSCSDTMVQTIHINHPSINLNTTEFDEEICIGDEVTFEASSTTPGATFEFFYNGVSLNVPSINDTLLITSTIANLDSIAVLSYENGCVSDTMPIFHYTVHNIPVFNFTNSDLDASICFGDSVYFTATSAGQPSYDYQFLINGTAITSYINNLNYYGTNALADNDFISAVCLDTSGCVDTTSITFNVDPLPTTALTESTGGNIICNGDLVVFTASGADDYEFFINGISIQGPSALATYSTSTLTANDTVTVNGITSAGCSVMAPESYYYIINPVPVTTMTDSDLDNIICSGEVVTFSASGAPVYEFFVNGISVQYGTASDYVTGSLVDGDNIVVYGEIGSCPSPSPVTVMTVLTSPTTVLTNDDNGDNTICYGTSVTFTGTGANNYEFFVNGVSVQGPSALSTYTTSSLSNGQTVLLEGESNTCIVSESDNFVVLTNPVVGLFSSDLDNIICDGNPITLTAANAGTYEFYVNGLSVQGPSVLTSLIDPASLVIGSNPIQVVGTAGNGCTDTSSVINVVLNPIPTIALTSSDFDNTICAGESVTFTGSGGDMYQFYIGATPQGSLSPTNTFTTSSLVSGQSVSIYGSAVGCPSSSNAIVTTVNPIPSISLLSSDLNNIYCTNDLVNYTAGGATNYEFVVNGVSQGASSPVNTLNSSGFPTGSFPLSVIGEANGCYNTANVTVLINLSPSASIVSSDLDNIICEGDVITYTGSNGALYEFMINGASQGAPGVSNSFALNTLSNGDEVSVIVYSSQGCSNADIMALITVNPTPVVTLVSSDLDYQICVGESVTFTASGATEYEFFVNGVSQGPPSAVSIFTTTGLTNGAIVSAVGTSIDCASTSNTFSFTVYSYPVVSLANNGTSEICVGENIDVVASGATNYQFLVNGTIASPLSPITTFNSPLNNGDLVTVQGETNGCMSTSANSYAYIVYNYPTLVSSALPGITICLNDQVDFSASGAMTYAFEVNGIPAQSGAGSSYSNTTLENGDQVTIVGLNGDCPSAPDTYTFTVNSMPLDLTVAASNMICENELATFTATGGDLYEFFLNGVSVASMSATNTYASSGFNDLDEITFTAYSNSTLCTQEFSDYVIMNVIDEPTVNPLSSVDFCEGDSVQLVSNGAYGNQWYLDGNPIVGATDTVYTAYGSGNYSVETTAGGIGTLWSFGLNANGTFGDGTNFNNPEPTVSISGVSFDEISSGADFTLAVTDAGEVYACGENSSGQLGNGTYTNSNVPNLVATLSSIKTVATSTTSSMAVTNSNEVYVWGNNVNGQLATGNTAVINFPFLNTSLANTDSIAGGKYHFVLLKNDGTVWTVGNNAFGQLGQGNLIGSTTAVQVMGLSNIISIGAGEYSSYAIDNFGNLYVWGANGNGQLGLNDLTNRLLPTVSPLKNVVNAQGGSTHSAFLTSTNKLYTTGGNSYGQLGTGDYVNRLIPTLVGINGANMVSTGQYSTLVKRIDRSVFAFGDNNEGQLSSLNGTTINVPEHIVDLDGVSFVEAGRSTSHVLYNENHSCVSSTTVVTMFVVPPVTISANGDTLSTIAAVSYQWYFEGSIIPGATNQTYLSNQTGNYSVEVTFANGCSGSSSLYFHSQVSIDELDLIAVNVFPNPTSGILNINLSQELNGEVELIVYDQMGRIVLREEGLMSGTTEINVAQLEAGVYNLSIVGNGVHLNKRFVRQ